MRKYQNESCHELGGACLIPAKYDVFLQVLSREGGEGAEAAVQRHVVGRHELREVAVV